MRPVSSLWRIKEPFKTPGATEAGRSQPGSTAYWELQAGAPSWLLVCQLLAQTIQDWSPLHPQYGTIGSDARSHIHASCHARVPQWGVQLLGSCVRSHHTFTLMSVRSHRRVSGSRHLCLNNAANHKHFKAMSKLLRPVLKACGILKNIYILTSFYLLPGFSGFRQFSLHIFQSLSALLS